MCYACRYMALSFCMTAIMMAIETNCATNHAHGIVLKISSVNLLSCLIVIYKYFLSVLTVVDIVPHGLSTQLNASADCVFLNVHLYM